MFEQYITVSSSDINILGDEYGLPLNAAPWGTSTDGGVYSVAANSTTGEIYVLNYTGPVQIYNPDRTLNRTVTGFGINQLNIRFNTSQSLYGTLRNVSGAGASVNALRIMNTSDDTEAYLIGFQSGFGFDFNPNNTNVFLMNGNAVVTEKTDLDVIVGSTFTITNVARSRTMKHQPGTNRIWVGGDSGGIAGGRLSYFDATTRAVTDVIIAATGAFATTIGTVTGMSFLGSRIFLHHTSARQNVNTANSKRISEIDDTGNVINQWKILAAKTSNYSDGCVYNNYSEPVIFYGIIDDRTVDVVGTLILPN
jgi:hypothetical protein